MRVNTHVDHATVFDPLPMSVTMKKPHPWAKLRRTIVTLVIVFVQIFNWTLASINFADGTIQAINCT